MRRAVLEMQTVRATRPFQFVSNHVFRRLVMGFHDVVLNWNAKALRRSSEVSRSEGTELRQHGFQILQAEEIRSVARQLRAEITDEAIGDTKREMLSHRDGSLMDARRGPVPLELSPETAVDVLRLAMSDQILRPVVAYLGVVPKLHHVGVTLTIPQENPAEPTGAELWHRDSGGLRSATLFVYLTDVPEEAGPLHVISHEDLPPSLRLPVDAATRASEAKQNFWLRGRFQDSDIARYVRPGRVRTVLGPAGTALLVDQHSTYHKGGYSTAEDRLALQIHYMTTAKPNETGVTELFDSLSDAARAEFLADNMRRFMFRPSRSLFQKMRIPQRLYYASLRLSAHPAPTTAGATLD